MASSQIIQVDKIPQLVLSREVKDMAIKNQFTAIISTVNKLMRDNFTLKSRTEQLNEWIVQLEKRLVTYDQRERMVLGEKGYI